MAVARLLGLRLGPADPGAQGREPVDRGERPGAMFADWELIGVPFRVVVGDRGLKEGKLEFQGRRDEAATAVAPADVLATLKARLAQ